MRLTLLWRKVPYWATEGYLRFQFRQVEANGKLHFNIAHLFAEKGSRIVLRLIMPKIPTQACNGNHRCQHKYCPTKLRLQ